MLIRKINESSRLIDSWGLPEAARESLNEEDRAELYEEFSEKSGYRRMENTQTAPERKG